MPTTKWNRRWGLELKRFINHKQPGYYGIQWGDPSNTGFKYWLEKIKQGDKLSGDLSKVIKLYIQPYLTHQTSVLEIGAGGGRWTQFLLPAREITVVELNAEFFPYLLERFSNEAYKIKFYQTSGYDLDGIYADSIDYVFSFGTFVHIEPEGIDMYLNQLRRVMKTGAIAVIHYSDKTKKFFQKANGLDPSAFSEMNSRKMERLVQKYRFCLLEHNHKLLNHSNIIVIEKIKG